MGYEEDKAERDELAAELEQWKTNFSHAMDTANDIYEQKLELLAELEFLKGKLSGGLNFDDNLQESIMSYVISEGEVNAVYAMQNELERVKAERDNLNRIVNEIWGMFYGQGLSVANWHQNGDLEPMEEFFEQNDWDPESCRAANESNEGENDV